VKKRSNVSLVGVAVSALFLFTQIGASEAVFGADATAEDEQWSNPNDATFGLHGIVIEDQQQGGGEGATSSFLSSYPDQAGNTYLCSSISDSKCSENFFYRAVLEPCKNEKDVDCIDSVTAVSKDGTRSSGRFGQLFPKKGFNAFKGSAEKLVPDGSSPGLWDISGAPHAFGTQYGVTVSISAQESKSGYTSKKRALYAEIVPVSLFKTTCEDGGLLPNGEKGRCLPLSYEMKSADGKTTVRYAGPAEDFGKYRCALWGDDSMCALRRAFPPDTRFELKVRLANEPSGWLHGRLSEPLVSFVEENKTTVVTLNGLPTKVPTFAAWGKWDTLPTSVQSYMSEKCTPTDGCSGRRPDSIWNDPYKRNLFLSPKQFKKEAFTEMALWREYAKDSAVALMSTWAIRTLSEGEMNSASSCIGGAAGVTGIVTTNATAYFEGPPSFDSETKTLKYEVAAPHFEKDGKTEFKGVYNLIVREDVAECLYGFSNAFAAPAPPEEFADESDPDVYVEEEPYTDEEFYAEEYPEFEEEYVDTDDGSYEMYEDVEYEEVPLEEFLEEEEDFTLTEDVSDSGEVVEEEEIFEETLVASIDASIITELQKAATANTAIELADGWFKFSATNFTFSKPTVKVNFAATPAKVLACLSGSSVRYVKSIRTQCPAGTSLVRTVYCIKGKTVDAVAGANPKCPKKTKVAKTLKCAKGDDARLVVGLVPKCAKGWSAVKTYVCVKGSIARKVSAVQVKCANGFALAKQLTCMKGKIITTVTAVKPSCPKGFRIKK
jgi:hypothetical protein